MKTYQIKITESLSRIIEIQAATPNQAKEKVKDMYLNEEIILDANDMITRPQIELFNE